MAKKNSIQIRLIQDFPQRVAEPQMSDPTSNLDARTQLFSSPPPSSSPPPYVTEEPTRHYENPNFVPPYTPPFDGQNVPYTYQAPRFAEMNQSNSRKVDKVGLPENILTALPYIPFYIGLITGVLVLLFVPKSENKVRFHAAQGLAAHVAILLISAILGGIGKVTDIASFGNGIFQVVTTIMLIVFAIKAWQGKPVHIEAVDDLTEWLEEKIQLKK